MKAGDINLPGEVLSRGIVFQVECEAEVQHVQAKSSVVAFNFHAKSKAVGINFQATSKASGNEFQGHSYAFSLEF